MAIDDNASYELTGYQVKDIAQKIRSKADSSSLASVATSGLYSDLTGAPTIPTVYNGTLTITQNGTTAGTFSANQSTNDTIALTDTTYSNFTGATSSAAGAAGLVPAPAAGDEGKVLKGDGTWDDLPTNHVTTDTDQEITGKKTIKNVVEIQNGQGTGSMWIGGNVNSNTVSNNNRHLARISVPSYNNITLASTLLGFDSSGDSDMHVAGKTYDAVSFGGMKKITNATSPMAIGFCVTDTRYATAAANKVYPLEMDASEARFNVQPNYAGTNLATVNDIPGTMSGATSSAAGSGGIVPAPAAGDEDKFLKGDGTWATAGGGGGGVVSFIATDMLQTKYSSVITWMQQHSLNPSTVQSLNFSPTNGTFVLLNDAGTELVPVDAVAEAFTQGSRILIKPMFMQYGGQMIQTAAYSGSVIASDVISSTSTNYPFVFAFTQENIVSQASTFTCKKYQQIGTYNNKVYASFQVAKSS